MPKRRRRPHGSRPASTPSGSPDAGASGSGEDPIAQFGRLLRESSEREAEAERQRAEQRRAAKARQAEAQAGADARRAARRDLDRAIDAVRRARETGRGRAEADVAWRAAKARVIELESGERPDWAPAVEDLTDSAGPASHQSP